MLHSIHSSKFTLEDRQLLAGLVRGHCDEVEQEGWDHAAPSALGYMKLTATSAFSCLQCSEFPNPAPSH